MELAVHPSGNPNYRGPNLRTAIKSRGRLREISGSRSEVNDLYEVGVQKHIATDRGWAIVSRPDARVRIRPTSTSERTVGQDPRDGDFLGYTFLTKLKHLRQQRVMTIRRSAANEVDNGRQRPQ
jgi:hypothetical protein